MIGPRRVEGYAIVSSNGMIADGAGEMPPTIRNDADQTYFQAALDQAGVLIQGRHSYEGGPHAPARKRLILTRQIATLAPDPSRSNALQWNPTGIEIERALEEFGAGAGPVAVIGGTEVFSMFLPVYDAFHLSRAAHASIPGGRPVFAEVGPYATPEDVLTRHGLKPGARRDLDPAAGVSVVRWQR